MKRSIKKEREFLSIFGEINGFTPYFEDAA
jgi:hypothetical protein